MSVETGFANAGVLMSGGLSTGLWPWGTEESKGMAPLYIGEEDSSESLAIPLAHLAAREFAMSGLQRVITLASEQGFDNLRGFFNSPLPDGTIERGIALHKEDKVAQEIARRLFGYDDMDITFVVQPTRAEDVIVDYDGDPYGTAFVMRLVQEIIQEMFLRNAQKHPEQPKNFIVRNIDDILLIRRGEQPELQKAIAAWQASGADHMIMGYPMERARSKRVGVLLKGVDGLLAELIEKPDPEVLPDGLNRFDANIGYYGFGQKIWRALDEEMAIPRPGGEHLITDVIEGARKMGQTFFIHSIDRTKTRRFDGGKAGGLIAASIFATQNVAYRPV